MSASTSALHLFRNSSMLYYVVCVGVGKLWTTCVFYVFCVKVSVCLLLGFKLEKVLP